MTSSHGDPFGDGTAPPAEPPAAPTTPAAQAPWRPGQGHDGPVSDLPRQALARMRQGYIDRGIIPADDPA